MQLYLFLEAIPFEWQYGNEKGSKQSLYLSNPSTLEITSEEKFRYKRKNGLQEYVHLGIITEEI